MRVSTPNRPVVIRSLGHYLPSVRLSNADLVAGGCPATAEWIKSKTGIEARHIAAVGEAFSDLAIPACVAALGSMPPSTIDSVIAAGDFLDFGGVRLTSGRVASALGIEGASTFDLKMGCPASVAGLHQAISLVAAGLSRRTLLAVAELNTHGIDWHDRGSIWFGDAGAAAVLEPCLDARYGVLATTMAGTGDGADILQVPAGGSVEPTTSATVANKRHVLYHDARAVFPFALEALVSTTRTLLAHVGLNIDDLDLLVPHQANLRVIEAAALEFGLPMTRIALSLKDCGNTAAPSVLLTLSQAVAEGRVKAGDLVATVGFGGGLAWGGQLIRWPDPRAFASRQDFSTEEQYR